jgi:hypothetical protein
MSVIFNTPFRGKQELSPSAFDLHLHCVWFGELLAMW